ncbi:MAG: hypothetical protein ACFB0C_11250 [Leptolyngbyaceae cyanobacterium]
MKNVPKILLRRYLRFYPEANQLGQFDYLSRYRWMGDLLNELRPEFFPEDKTTEAASEDLEAAPPDEVVLQILDTHIRGQRGTYHVEQWLRARGAGHLFVATQVGANQPVLVKEYLLPSRLFNEEEARQRQQAFTRLAGLALADGRPQDSRILAPLEAIADTRSVERCYLITDQRDAYPTLRHQLATTGALSTPQVREVLDQVLQSLTFLHLQRFVLPAGQLQSGLVHGNLGLDSLIWVEPAAAEPSSQQWFIYLCDLALWERIFDPPAVEMPTHTVAADLQDLGRVAFALLVGRDDPNLNPANHEHWPATDPALRSFILRLLAVEPPFESAVIAREALRAIPPGMVQSDQAISVDQEATKQKRRFPWISFGVGLIVLALLGVAGWFIWRWWSGRAALAQPRLCCLKDVTAVPPGPFVYTAVEGSTWSQVARQGPVTLGLPSFNQQLAEDQPDFQIIFQPAPSADVAIAAVEAGEIDFAVVPWVEDLPLTLEVQVVAYDGLAIMVPFSYSQRRQGLPRTLEGSLTLEQVRRLYNGEFVSWRDVGGADMPVRLYAPENFESFALFDALVYPETSFRPGDSTAQLNVLPTFEMLRTVIRDFEEEEVGAIAFAPLSQVIGQCSIYPLALKAPGKAAIQPLSLTTGEPIDPSLDLCDRKGQYFPDLEALQKRIYPLAYPIVVVYPLDNQVPPAGKKFASLLLTDEGQQFLWRNGFVPLYPDAARVTPRRISEQNDAN